ncbi:hypothetical protein [Pseudoclavibacter sp. 8L]|uniref:hypothetical protein n=1 Tax=Pseudoclavibacter sp. 8L TaxID=2653162 RepID=UPI0012F2DEEB|nr:hypothetical protein [Pseudoclavibacter sp. 8L]VXB32130.1 conserved hypothetical protein [Pseudoclavibacter sp. 8L]
MDIETLRAWGTLATALGVGSVIWPATKHIFQRITGRARHVRDEVDEAYKQVNAARRAADREARLRRKLEEHAGWLTKRMIASDCFDVADIPTWPEYPPDTEPTPTKE